MRKAQEIIDLSYSFQKHAQQGVDASEDGELRPLIVDIMGIFFGIGARVNPEFFSVSDNVAWDAGIAGWKRPTKAELIYQIEDPNKDEVARVPRDDQGAEPSMPSVYRLGQAYFPTDPTGAAKGPAANDALFFLYSKRPDDILDLNADIDELWPAGHERLLALELGIYIALKDKRESDVSRLVTERDRYLTRFFMFLEHEDIGERRRTGATRKFQRSSVVSINSLLAGGSSVELPE